MKQRNYKKRDGIKKIAQDMKEEFNKDMENLRKKKKSNRNPENKKFLKSNKKYS
jgi:hypothetical protein